MEVSSAYYLSDGELHPKEASRRCQGSDLGSPLIGTIVSRTQHRPVAHERLDERSHSIRLSGGLDVVCAGLDCHQRFQSIPPIKSTTSAHRRWQSEHQPLLESAAVEVCG